MTHGWNVQARTPYIDLWLVIHHPIHPCRCDVPNNSEVASVQLFMCCLDQPILNYDSPTYCKYDYAHNKGWIHMWDTIYWLQTQHIGHQHVWRDEVACRVIDDISLVHVLMYNMEDIHCQGAHVMDVWNHKFNGGHWARTMHFIFHAT